MLRAIKSRRLRWAGNVVRMKEVKSFFKILTGKRTIRRSRSRREDNVGLGFK